MPHGPVADGTRLTSKGAYDGIVPDINHIRVFGCICYSYIGPKSWPAGTKSRKLLDRGRECVFAGHNEKTTNQHWVYAPDLGRAELAKTVDFDEKREGGGFNQQIRQSDGILSQGTLYHNFTSSASPTRNLTKYSRKQDTFNISTSIISTLSNTSMITPTIQLDADLITRHNINNSSSVMHQSSSDISQILLDSVTKQSETIVTAG